MVRRARVDGRCAHHAARPLRPGAGHNPLPCAVGTIGAVQLVPLLVATLFGGTVIDRVDRRKILIWLQLGMAATSAILVGCALVPHPPLWWLYVAAGITAALSGVELPTRSAMVPNMVRADVLPAALSINQLMWNTAWVAGPLMAGAVISAFGFAWAYALDVVTYAATFVAALLMQPHPPRPRAEGTAGCLGPPRDRRC